MDTAVNELWASSPVSTRAVGTYEHDQIRLYVGLPGAVALQDPHDQGSDAYVPAGTYFMHKPSASRVIHSSRRARRPRTAHASHRSPPGPR
ncbi:hypothetical protein GCM10010521_19370 [Streptomyces rameus]|uniref:Uncharacterized protein n=1 Tax=Streptomyces rameus TaxID=68261 RepID=A0ABP6N1N9_9ACTN